MTASSSIPPTVTAPPTIGDAGESRPGARIGNRYTIQREIGKGGMGEVVAARDEQIHRDVAIKRTRSRTPNERAVARFLREAQIQGRLEHPAIVPVHEIGHDEDGAPYFVMKKLTGTTLASILAGDGLPRQRLLRTFAEICLAVEFAHVRGIVHRDLKPENIMLGEFGEVYILDWGVAKILGEEASDLADVSSDHTAVATSAGAAVGTPGYMAPEQASGERDIDGRADIYALGCVLFEILAGEPLHPRDVRVPTDRDARPSRRAPDRDVPPELDALCVEATAHDRGKRLASARALGDRLQRYLDGDRDLALRRTLAREHLDRAQRAYHGNGEVERRDAMREATAALALDPALEPAAALVGRLMLDPPRETPREVELAIRDEDRRMAHANARGGFWVLLATIAFLPLFSWITPAGSPHFRVLAAILALDVIVVALAMRARRPTPGLIVVGNAVIILIVARMFSPLLIAPGLAAVLGMALVMWPQFSILGSAVAIAVLNSAAVLLPWVLEWTNVMSRTMSVGKDGILLRAPVIAGAEGPTTICAAVYTVVLIGSACIVAATMRARHRAAHRTLQMQAWQLRQLVPAEHAS
jgi:serine/threonine protein kinase